jgi:hypothetical protein
MPGHKGLTAGAPSPKLVPKTRGLLLQEVNDLKCLGIDRMACVGAFVNDGIQFLDPGGCHIRNVVRNRPQRHSVGVVLIDAGFGQLYLFFELLRRKVGGSTSRVV